MKTSKMKTKYASLDVGGTVKDTGAKTLIGADEDANDVRMRI